MGSMANGIQLSQQQQLSNAMNHAQQMNGLHAMNIQMNGHHHLQNGFVNGTLQSQNGHLHHTPLRVDVQESESEDSGQCVEQKNEDNDGSHCFHRFGDQEYVLNREE